MSNSAVVARKAEPGAYLTGAHLVRAARFWWGSSLCLLLFFSVCYFGYFLFFIVFVCFLGLIFIPGPSLSNLCSQFRS